MINKASLVVHWSNGPVFMCIEHGEKLQALGNYLGTPVHVEPYNGPELCLNCVNESKKNDQ